MDFTEIRDIVASWLAVSVAFGWVMRDSFSEMLAWPNNFAFAVVVAMVAVGTGFVLHEIMHRTIAIRFGAKARYVSWPFGLALALLMAFSLNVVFAAPGAVYIFGTRINKRQNGLISLAGPATNILLGLFFISTAMLLGKGFLGTIAAVSASINLWLATFNLIPVFPLDGSKVFAWNKAVWALLFFPLFLIIAFL